MTDHATHAGLTVDPRLSAFIEEQALPGTGIDPSRFWAGVRAIFDTFAPRNAALLATRDRLQDQLDAWHAVHAGQPIDQAEYQPFLRDIGYLVDEPAPFTVSPENVDPEVAKLAGPQLVVPILNARFLLNAANARWGSLYDALYGTDVLGAAKPGGYDPEHGAKVIAWAKAFLDEVVPLDHGASWTEYYSDPPLQDESQWVGHDGESMLFRHKGLHIEVVVDRDDPVGKNDPMGIADVILESALTTIADLEDSVAAVDAEDKVVGYTNWLGLMRGDLSDTFDKGGQTITRRLNDDRTWLAPLDGTPFTLPGRSLMFVRNVGHLMTTPAVLLPDGGEAPE
ncbi:MAG TPA: malate synthase G, partial [Sphingomonas sp.]